MKHFVNLTLSPMCPYSLSRTVRSKQEFSHLERTHIFFAPCRFKARTTDQLVSLETPLMSSGCLGHNDEKDSEAEAGFYRRKLTGDVCVPCRSRRYECIFIVSDLDTANKAAYLPLNA